MIANAFESGMRVRVSSGPNRGRLGEVLGCREVLAAGASTAMADDAATRTKAFMYEVRFDDGERVTLMQSLLEAAG